MSHRLTLVLLVTIVGSGTSGCTGGAERCSSCVGRPDATGGGGSNSLDATVIDRGNGGSGGGIVGTGGTGGTGSGGNGLGGAGGSSVGSGGSGGDIDAGSGGSSGGGGTTPGTDSGAPDLPRDTGGGQPDLGPPDLGMETAPPPMFVAFYPFNQTTGTVATDTSGNGHNGTLTGGAVFGTAGMIRQDLNLTNAATGGTQYVALPAGLLATVTDMTIAFWVRPRTDRTWGRVFDFGTSQTINMFLTQHAGNAPNFMRFAITTMGSTMEQRLEGAAVLPINTWTHVAVVLGASGGTLYVNGAVVSSSAAVVLRPMSMGSTANNWIGRSQYAPDPYFDGEIDEFRIYSQALTAAEISTVYTAR